MKKVKLIFVGAPDYEEVKKDNNRLPKWDFKANGVGSFLECVLMSVNEYTAPATQQKFKVYDVRHRGTREAFSIIPNKVLAQRLESIPLYSAVKIVYKGTVAPKNYMNYDVFRDKSFTFDPSIWQTIVYENTAGAATTTQPQQQQNQTTQLPPVQTAQVTDDDLPF